MKAPAYRPQNRRVRPRKIVLGLATLAAASSVHAQSTWVGDTSQDWNDQLNWTSDLAPSGNFTINTSTGNYPIISANSAFTPVDAFLADGGSNTARLDHRAGSLSLANITASGNWFFVARNSATATATYNLADTSSAGGGVSGFAQGSGTLNVGKFFVGGAYFGANGNGTVNINTSGSLNANSTQSFTDGAGNQNASIVIGRGASGVGTVNFENGTINSAGQTWVGSIGTGTVNQTGGTANITGALVLARNNNNTQAGSGTWNVSGTGVVNVENDLIVAYAGNASAQGTLNIGTGGVVNVATTTERWMIVNQWDSAGGNVNINGGQLNLNANTDLRFSTGNGTGASVVTLNSGAITSYSGNGTGSSTSGVLDLNHAGGAAANNTVNLNGGTLTIAQIITTNNNGTATFNFNGGVLRAANNSANFVDLGGASQTAVVQSGGAIVDSNGFDVTIVQSLLDGGGAGGFTKQGNGTVNLIGANTFTGDIVIEAGTLSISSAFIDDAADVFLTTGTIFDLDFVGADSIGFLYIDGLSQALGTYGAIGSGADHELSFFSGTGFLNVTSAIPEPASFAVLGGLAALGLGATRRRRR